MAIHIGPAGWSYADWNGIVYPSQRPPGFHGLSWLTRLFDCVEINSSFYALPQPKNSARWSTLVRDHRDFRFAVKLHRSFTHAPAPKSPEQQAQWTKTAAEFHAGIAPMVKAKRLVALLVQFPVTFLFGSTEVARLGLIRRLFDGLPLVLEVRHESWFTPQGLSTTRGMGFVTAHLDLPFAWNHPPPLHRSTGPLAYFRLHGRNQEAWFNPKAGRDQRYDYLYGEQELTELAHKAKLLAGAHDELYVVTNNHFQGKAVANALELKAMLQPPAAPKPEAPTELVHRYPRLASQVRPFGQEDLFA